MGKMLITATLLKCLSPILTIVASLGGRLFRPVRLPEEKYALQHFFQSFAPNLASDHLLIHKLYTAWQANRGSFNGQIAHVEQFLSPMAMRRLDDSRRQILRELREHFGMITSDVDSNSENEALLRFVLASGFYPDIAIYKTRRNSFQLCTIREASVAASSVIHELTPKALLHRGRVEGEGLPWRSDDLKSFTLGRIASFSKSANIESRLSPTFGAKNAHFFIYEELLDVGQKLLNRMTAIDPILLVIIANRIESFKEELTQSSVIQHDGKQVLFSKMSVKIDNWFSLWSKFPTHQQSDLYLLIKMRSYWNAFVQFLIYKQLSKDTLSTQQSAAVNLFIDAIMKLLSSTTIHRVPQRGDGMEGEGI